MAAEGEEEVPLLKEDESTKPNWPPRDLCVTVFTEYGVLESGLSNVQDLSQITTNLIVRLLNLAVQVEEIEAKVGSAASSSGSLPMDVDQFRAWISANFTETVQSRLDEVGPVPPSPALQPSGPLPKTPENDKFEITARASTLGEIKLGKALGIKIIAPERTVEPLKVDTIAFACVENLCYENEENNAIEVPLVRRGKGEGEISVDWHTENVTVMDESYQDESGTVKFADGEFHQMISIPLIDNDEWNLEAIELVHLSNPSSNAQLGDLTTTQAIILNEDVFPHDEDDFNNALAMVWAFFQHIWHDLKSDTNLGLFLRIYPGLAWIVTQLVLLFTLQKAIPDEDMKLVAILAGAFVSSTILWHICMDTFEDMRLGGKARMLLRRAVVGTLLQLTNSEKEKFTSGKCLAIMSEQVENSVNVCYLGVMNIWACCVLLLAMTGLSIYVTRRTPFILPCPFVMMIIDMIALYCRIPGQIKLYNEWIDQDNLCKGIVAEMSEQSSLITAYRAGFLMEKRFVKENGEQNRRRFIAVKYQQVTEKILKWNHTLFITVILCLGAYRTMNNIMKVPEYVLVMNTIMNFDREITNLFNQLSLAVNGFVSVQRVAEILNAPTRKKTHLAARYIRRKVMDDMAGGDPNFRLDPDCMLLYNVEYDYEVNHAREAAGRPDEDGVFNTGDVQVQMDSNGKPSGTMGPFTVAIEQGQIISVRSGKNSSGKKTFLQLIGKSLTPTDGLVYIPENLNSVYIPGEPLLLNSTLIENLRFGNAVDHPEAEILDLCKTVGVGEELLIVEDGRWIAKDFQVGVNGSKLSVSSRIYICLVRALLSSVDVLLLSNTLDILSPTEGEGFLQLLKDWVQARGMSCLSADNPTGLDTGMKRQKSVFFVSKTDSLIEAAHATITLK